MPNDNLIMLARILMRYPNTPGGPEFFFPLKQEVWPEALAPLPEPIRQRTLELVTEVRERIPTDFKACCVFHHEGMSLMVEYDDGNLSSSDGHAPLFTSRKSMRRNLRSFDWDSRRKLHFEKCTVFDALASEAEDRPANIPSSLEAAKAYAAQLDEIFKTLRTAKNPITFVMVHVREGDGVVDIVDYPSRSALVHTMADLMTTQHEILAVVENGERWTFDAIEEAKREAVGYLGRISRAKAERRYPMHYENLSR